MPSIIFGCGDVGRRIAIQLIHSGTSPDDILAYVKSVESAELCAAHKVLALRVDLDKLDRELSLCHGANVYYTVAPQKSGLCDERSKSLLATWSATNVVPRKVVLISTTGVYGDCQGDWVTEASTTAPKTERGQRRLDSEQRWLAWGRKTGVPIVVLRVPGIYAYSRLPRKRLLARTPVVRAQECGFVNRIHADDLAGICIAAMDRGGAAEVFNATDGRPGKISEYLQLAAHVLGMEPLPEISLAEAQTLLSAGMLSYLNESRRISNEKMLNELGVELLYPDFRLGIKN